MSPPLSPLGRLVHKLRLHLPGDLSAQERRAPTSPLDACVRLVYQGRVLDVVWAVARGYMLYNPVAPTSEPFGNFLHPNDTFAETLRFLDPRAPVGRAHLHALVAELVVFSRATEVRVHERPAPNGLEFHVEVRHPAGLARAPTGLFEDLHHLVRRYAGFSYSVGDPTTAEYWPDVPCVRPRPQLDGGLR